MNHDNALQLIEDLVHGSLAEPVKRDLMTHIDFCEECQALSDTYRTLADAFDEDDEHPASDAVVHYALDAQSLDETVRDRIASHLGVCVNCRLEVDATRAAEEALGKEDDGSAEATDDSRTPVEFPYLKTGLAAAVIVAALGYPTYLGLFELPRMKEKLARLDPASNVHDLGTTTWTGPVEIIVLQNPLRTGNEEVLPVEIGDAPCVVLAVDLSMNGVGDAKSALRLAIEDAEGRLVWSQELSPKDMRRQIESSGAVTVLVPSRVLPEGRLTTSVFRQIAGGEESVFRGDFQVVQASEESTSSSPKR